jgi:hypothetical protein
MPASAIDGSASAVSMVGKVGVRRTIASIYRNSVQVVQANPFLVFNARRNP